MTEILRQVLATLPVVAALLLVGYTNTAKTTRVRQYPMPAIAVGYAIVALIALYAFNRWIEDVLRSLFAYVPLVASWYDTAWQYAIENTAILLVFALVKFLLNRVFDRVFQGEDFAGSSFVEGIYRYDPALSTWFVRAQNGMLRIYLRAFYWSSVAIVVVLMSSVGAFSSWAGFAAISFPAIAALVIGEFYFAIDGVTAREFRRDVLGEADRADRIVDYSGVRDVLKETFGPRVIHDSVAVSSADATRTHRLLDTLSHSTDDIDRLAAGYFEGLKQAGHDLDSNLISAAADLMHGRSTLINNPFYGDLTPYLVFPAYYHLLHYRKCLVISGRDAISNDLVEWLDQGLESISGIPDLWRVEALTADSRYDLDVGILRFADIHNLELLRANDQFLRDVEYVILAEPSRTLATGQLGLELVLRRCAGGGSPVFAAFDRNHDGLVDALSHLLKVELTDVVAAAVPHGVSSEIVWRADGTPMHGVVLPSITRYLGMGTEIGAVALKYQVQQVEWIGADAFPVEDMMWIAGQYYGQINSFADLDISQHALKESISARANPWDLSRAPNRFLIVEDEICNVFETIRLYSTRAQEQGLVNLISEDYLLRDYMVDNSIIFANDPKAVPAIVPDYARTDRNLALRLILTLRAFGMTEHELGREFELIGHSLPKLVPPRLGDQDEEERDAPAIVALRDLIERHLGHGDVLIAKTIGPKDYMARGADPLIRRYSIPSGTALDDVVDALGAAYFVVEDESEERNYIGSALFGLVYQTMLPGQFVTYAGKYYEVRSVGSELHQRGVVLRRAAEHIRDRRTYRQLRAFSITNVETSDRAAASVTVDDVLISRVFATVAVDSLGYIEMQTRSDLASGRETLLSGIPRRTYNQKELLVIGLPGVPDSVRRTIATLLNELFVTLFPQSHNYLVALTVDPDRDFGRLLDHLTLDGESTSIFIVEDSPIDMGLIIAVERNWRRIFEIIADYLEWHTLEPAPERAKAELLTVFPDDSPEEIAERARIVAAQNANGPTRARAPRRVRWWRRLARTIRGWFTSKPNPGDQPGETGATETPASTPAQGDVHSSGVTINDVQPKSRPFVVDLPPTHVAINVDGGLPEQSPHHSGSSAANSSQTESNAEANSPIEPDPAAMKEAPAVEAEMDDRS